MPPKKKNIPKDLKTINILKNEKAHLFPFFISLAVYFAFFIPMQEQTLFGMVLKCLPIISLMYFVHSHGLRHPKTDQEQNGLIFFGLFFSCIGDALLDFKPYFIHGTIVFGVAQILHIIAFGFKPGKYGLGLKVLLVMSLPLLLITPGLNKEDTPTWITISAYSPLLITMIWRALARAKNREGKYTLAKLLPTLGAISFGISDSTLAINKYYAPVPYAQFIIMLTYYGAQFGIGMTAIDHEEFDTNKEN